MLALLIILKILLYIMIFLAGLILLLLVLPFDYSGQVLTADGFRVKLALRWAWKLLGISAEIEGEDVDIALCLLNARVYKLKGRDTRDKGKHSKVQKDEKKKKGRKSFELKDVTDKELMNEVIEYIKRMFCIIKPKQLYLSGTYGFDDPSLTGIICGAAGAIKSLIPHANLNLTPDFSQEILEIDLCAEGRIIVGSLAYQTVKTVFKMPVRKILFKKKKVETFS